MNRVIIGHVLDALKMLDDGSVHLCVTSPPYWSLRDYKAPPVVWPDGWKGQLGLEPTPELYVQHLVEIFREVKRVLRKDGTCWLNMGDSYASTSGAGLHTRERNKIRANGDLPNAPKEYRYHTDPFLKKDSVIKPKDLCMIPARVALALQADWWYLRSDIIWAKPNPMPESVTDRPTTAHEHIFLLTKSSRYFYDADAVREKSGTKPGATWDERVAAGAGKINNKDNPREHTHGNGSAGTNLTPQDGRRNLRSVWTITTRGTKDAHFAVFPTEIPATCIKTSPTKICLECGAGWERVREKTGEYTTQWGRNYSEVRLEGLEGQRNDIAQEQMMVGIYKTLGFRPTCSCEGETGRAVILDPFAGSGTVGEAALKLGRDYILIEISPEYKKLIDKRLAGITAPLIPDAL